MTKQHKASLEPDQDKIAFDLKYKKQEYQKYDGTITTGTTGNYIYVQYDSIRVFLFSETFDYKEIFTSGLLSGQIIYCKTDSLCRPAPDLDWIDTTKEKLNFMGWTGHTIRIEHFEELKHLNPNPTVRRFKFWSLPHKIRMNGGNDIFLLELTNKNADKSTDLKSFIKGAEVTFLIKDGMML